MVFDTINIYIYMYNICGFGFGFWMIFRTFHAMFELFLGSFPSTIPKNASSLCRFRCGLARRARRCQKKNMCVSQNGQTNIDVENLWKPMGLPRKLIYKMLRFSTFFSWFTSGSIKIGRRLCQSAKHALATSTQQRNIANSIDPEHG